MANWIKIRKIKSIESLDFRVPGPGVHLLSGTNGAGKTTLLACLRRIGHGNAFQNHFLTSLHSDRLDSFSEAEVTYCVGERSVTYAYAGERWVPRPRSASNLVRAFNYPDVYYAGATAARITPRPEDFKPRGMHPAPLALREAANSIFQTSRFDNLKTINLTTGNRNQAFVLAPTPVPGTGRQRYVSEKNFSLGELCVLKLLRELIDCRNGSLVLIDELELALHPRAQIGLLKYLEEIAAEKALTVIVSTHSVTLLKTAPRLKILFLEKRDGCTEVLSGCFPAYALGNLAFSEERVPDAVLYVEDEAARGVLDNLVRLTIAAKYSAATDVFPTVEVVPVGDYQNVVRFYQRNRAMLPDQVSQWIVLDHDVQAESLRIMAASSNSSIRDAFFEFESQIRYLPWTPEVGVIEFLIANRVTTQQALRTRFTNSFISIPASALTITSNGGPARRTQCKSALKGLIIQICAQVPSLREENLLDELFKLFAESYFQNHRAEAMQLVAPLIA